MEKKFSYTIKQFHIGGFGQAVGQESIFYVLEDGTVEYTPLYKDLKDNYNQDDNSKKFNSYGKLPGISDILYVKGMQASKKYSEESSSVYYTTVAVKSDGSYYDLNNIMPK